MCHFKRYVIFCAFAASILLTKSSDWQQIDFGLSSLLCTVYSLLGSKIPHRHAMPVLMSGKCLIDGVVLAMNGRRTTMKLGSLM